MTVLTGTDALNALAEDKPEEKASNEFTYLKSGDSITVKVPGINMISEFVYGSFGKNIHSFIAKNPSEKLASGFPTKNLTPFDKAYKYYKDQSDDWQDKMSQEANHYRANRKFTLGFYDLTTGDPIMVEFTRNQANTIVDVIKKYEARLDQFAFELSKTGKSRDTVVSLSLIPVLEDLTETQQKNFEKLPSTFDAKNFEGLYWESDDAEMVEKLTQSGFDISLVGLEAPKQGDQESAPDEVTDIDTDDLPF